MITQDGRLLNIFIPSLAKDFLLLQTLTVREGISELFNIEVELLHEEDSPGYETTEIDAASILGMPSTILISQKDGLQRFYNGIIQTFSQGYRDTRFSKYRATIVPAVWVLTQNIQSRIFQNLSVPEILKRVFEGFEVVFMLQRTYHPRNYCTQYRESDFDFASRLMEEEGIYYYFEHENNTHKMIIADTPQAHLPCPGKSSIPCFIKVERQDDWISSITSWTTDYKLQSSKVTLWDFHFQLPHRSLEATSISRFNSTSAAASNLKELEIYDFPGGYAHKYDGIDKSGGENPSELQKVFEDNKKTAQDKIEQIDSQYKTIHATSDCAAISTGFKFTLFNHPNKSSNGDYVVTKAIHHAVQSPGYLSGDEVENPYMVTFECIPHGSGHPPFRPPRKTPKPLIYGSQTAYVVGPAGEEIFTDKYGRVKVQFHWDRDGKDNEASSCWLRVAQSWAGNKWGTMFIPRVGMEVIVSFLEGDPNQPIITGCVYNPISMPPYSLPEEKTKSTIKSHSSKGGGGFNEIRFEDKKGKEQIFIHAQRRMDVRVRGSLYETCGGDRHEIIGVKNSNLPGGNLAITVNKNYDLKIKDSFYIGIEGKLNESVKGEVVENYQNSLSTIVKNKAQLNALEVTIEAKTKISLKVGGNCIIVDPSGITIAGTIVKINSGGFASGAIDPFITDPLDAEAAETEKAGFALSVRNRKQLRSQHYIAPPRPNENRRITLIRSILAQSEQGRHALEVYDRYVVNSTFNKGQGSYYDPNTNQINLDPSENLKTLASTFVNEIKHAEAFCERILEGIQNQSIEDYIKAMLQEIADGIAASIESIKELQQAGVDALQDLINNIQNKIQEAIDEIVSSIEETIKELQQLATEALQDCIDLINNVQNMLQQAANEIVSNIEESIKELQQSATEALQDCINNVQNTLQQAANEIVSNIEENVKELQQSATEALQDCINNVQNTLQQATNEIVSNVEESIKELQQSATEALQDCINNVQNTLQETANEIVSNIEENVKELQQSATEALQDCINNVQNTLQQATNEIVSNVEESIKELQQSAVDTLKSSFPLENEYNEAYNNAVEEARRNNPSITDEEADSIGRQAGRQRVMEGVINGEVVPSTNTQTTYTDYYKENWNSLHGN